MNHSCARPWPVLLLSVPSHPPRALPRLCRAACPHGAPNSYRNLVSSCVECNTQKGETVAEDFLRGLYRDGRLTAIELAGRLRAVEALVAGKLRPRCTVRKQRTNSVVEQSEFRLRLRRRRSRDRLGVPQGGELNLVSVQREIVFENDVQSRAARKFGFRPASQENGRQPCCRANPGADAEAFHAVSNRADPCPGSGCFRDRARVLPFAARASDLAFGIHGLFAAGIGASWRGIQADGVAVRQKQGVEAQPEFPAALDLSGPLRVQQLSFQIATHRDS